MVNKPFSQACENNKNPILEILRDVFANTKQVLEIGSGTGQHAVYFAEHLQHLHWQPSDRRENLAGIQTWIDAFPQKNLLPIIELDVTQAQWPQSVDAVFSANTTHIMPWEIAQLMLQKVASLLPADGTFALYGPFNYRGEFTSESNANFDRWLKNAAPHQGIRDFEKVNEIVCKQGLTLLKDYAMPANNRLLTWKK